MVREISKRNADKVIKTVTSSQWFAGFPNKPTQSLLSVGHQEIERALRYPFPYALPAPPSPIIRIGYVSSDFTNHPLAHLMQSVFRFHDRTRFKVYCYSLSASDNSTFRKEIESGSDSFVDVFGWSVKEIVERITGDGIHVLCNLNGYLLLLN
jgi:protein O-GlcNAc transferase